ncbi:MAG: hypothetical protein PHF97_11105 [Bacteroidales bacterium]|nr:hypothetical protein [Bacteroidales bacterium]
MNSIDIIALSHSFDDRNGVPALLFQQDRHALYWLGVPEDSAFRCNCYLIVDGEEGILIYPGGKTEFEFVQSSIEKVLPLTNLMGMIICQPDPDETSAIIDWLKLNPGMKIITAPRTNTKLSHYGSLDWSWHNVSEEPVFSFKSGQKLDFIPAPFLPCSETFTIYDKTSRFLFSGDLWSAIDMDWKLVVENFAAHELKLSLFHLDYFPSSLTLKGYLKQIRNLKLEAILPRHGSIIPLKNISFALEYLNRLRCGIDLIYPDLR